MSEEFIPTVSHIVCVDKDFNIGIGNSMPWCHIKEELNYFYNTTKGNIVLMGGNTYRSIGFKPLKNRINIVVSKSLELSDSDDLYVRDSVEEALELAHYLALRGMIDIFIIGGASIYEQTKDAISKVYMTVLDVSYTNKPLKNYITPYPFIKYDCDILDGFEMVEKNRLLSTNYFYGIHTTVWEKS